MTSTQTKTQYFVTSSVLNSVITELDQSGQKTRTFVYQGGEVLAWQQKSGSTETMAWEHRDPSQASVRGSSAAAELEPLGSNAGVFKGFVIPPPRSQQTLEAERSYPFFASMTVGKCVLDGIDSTCELAGGEGAVQCPHNICRGINPRTNRVEQYIARADGLAGYVPEGARLLENGRYVGSSDHSIELQPTQDRFLEHGVNFGISPQNPTPCEKYLANLFGDRGAYFADVDDGDPVDLTVIGGANGGSRPPAGLERHVHLYGSESDATKMTDVYIPGGGTILPLARSLRDERTNPYVGRTSDGDATYMLVYFSRLGSLRNVTLAIFHIADFTQNRQKDGRTRVGTLGGDDEGGPWTFMDRNGNRTKGKHIHLDLWRGRYGSLPARERRPSIRAKFSGICPPSLR